MLMPAFVTACIIFGAAQTTYLESAHGSSRPPQSAACAAWKDHLGDLLGQHRFTDDIGDSEFGTFIGQFYEAQTACDAGHYATGLSIYESISLGSTNVRWLR
jgi:hypothetical protein